VGNFSPEKVGNFSPELTTNGARGEQCVEARPRAEVDDAIARSEFAECERVADARERFDARRGEPVDRRGIIAESLGARRTDFERISRSGARASAVNRSRMASSISDRVFSFIPQASAAGTRAPRIHSTRHVRSRWPLSCFRNVAVDVDRRFRFAAR